jgi:hypothetical protein
MGIARVKIFGRRKTNNFNTSKKATPFERKRSARANTRSKRRRTENTDNPKIKEPKNSLIIYKCSFFIILILKNYNSNQHTQTIIVNPFNLYSKKIIFF